MMNEKDMSEKLRILLTHWLEHNQSHATEMGKWQGVAETSGHSEAAALIQQAILGIQETDKALAAALEKLGGALSSHHHHHH